MCFTTHRSWHTTHSTVRPGPKMYWNWFENTVPFLISCHLETWTWSMTRLSCGSWKQVAAVALKLMWMHMPSPPGACSSVARSAGASHPLQPGRRRMSWNSTRMGRSISGMNICPGSSSKMWSYHQAEGWGMAFLHLFATVGIMNGVGLECRWCKRRFGRPSFDYQGGTMSMHPCVLATLILSIHVRHSWFLTQFLSVGNLHTWFRIEVFIVVWVSPWIGYPRNSALQKTTCSPVAMVLNQGKSTTSGPTHIVLFAIIYIYLLYIPFESIMSLEFGWLYNALQFWGNSPWTPLELMLVSWSLRRCHLLRSRLHPSDRSVGSFSWSFDHLAVQPTDGHQLSAQFHGADSLHTWPVGFVATDAGTGAKIRNLVTGWDSWIAGFGGFSGCEWRWGSASGRTRAGSGDVECSAGKGEIWCASEASTTEAGAKRNCAWWAGFGANAQEDSICHQTVGTESFRFGRGFRLSHRIVAPPRHDGNKLWYPWTDLKAMRRQDVTRGRSAGAVTEESEGLPMFLTFAEQKVLKKCFQKFISFQDPLTTLTKWF